MPGGIPVMCLGSKTMPLYGPSGMVKPMTKTVLVEGRPIACWGDPVTTHGNPYNPKKPGFNPPCACATVAEGAPTVLAYGRMIAHMHSELTCMLHFLDLVPAKTVRVGAAVDLTGE